MVSSPGERHEKYSVLLLNNCAEDCKLNDSVFLGEGAQGIRHHPNAAYKNRLHGLSTNRTVLNLVAAGSGLQSTVGTVSSTRANLIYFVYLGEGANPCVLCFFCLHE